MNLDAVAWPGVLWVEGERLWSVFDADFRAE